MNIWYVCNRHYLDLLYPAPMKWNLFLNNMFTKWYSTMCRIPNSWGIQTMNTCLHSTATTLELKWNACCLCSGCFWYTDIFYIRWEQTGLTTFIARLGIVLQHSQVNYTPKMLQEYADLKKEQFWIRLKLDNPLDGFLKLQLGWLEIVLQCSNKMN